MTRINVVHPNYLCDQHLLSENREIVRIPHYIAKKNGSVKISKEPRYILGRGHVTFFRDKLLFLYTRYISIQKECIQRGFRVSFRWPEITMNYLNLWNDYTVTENDMKKNIERIHEKMPFRPRFSKKSKGVNLRSLLHLDQKFEIYITKFLINKKIDQ